MSSTVGSTYIQGLFPLAIVVIAGMIFGCAGGDLPAEEARRLFSLPQHVVDVGNEAPLIRYSRSIQGGAHTDGAWTGGWQITHAMTAWSGKTSGDATLLEQIAYNLEGQHAISANGGYPAQHERHMTGAYAILRHTPRFWEDVLTGEQRRKIDLVMTACLIASAYTTSDATYAGGATPTALDGDTNLHRGWNPNYREGMFGGLLVATVYFGGVDRVHEMLNGYDHTAFVDVLSAAGLDNIHETFTWAVDYPESGAPTGDEIQRNVRAYRYEDRRLPEPMDLYYELTMNTYGREVNCGLNDGRGIEVNGMPAGTIVSGCESLPNRGEQGMLMEFDARDADGPRSSIGYAYDGFRANLTNHAAVIAGGYWRPGEKADEILRRMDVGITDLRYKLEHGYINYSRGRGSAEVFDVHREHWDWSFRTTLPLWEEGLEPLHLAQRR